MTVPCPECGAQLHQLEDRAVTVEYACYACGIIWYGVTSVSQIRSHHPATDHADRGGEAPC